MEQPAKNGALHHHPRYHTDYHLAELKSYIAPWFRDLIVFTFAPTFLAWRKPSNMEILQETGWFHLYTLLLLTVQAFTPVLQPFIV